MSSNNVTLTEEQKAQIRESRNAPQNPGLNQMVDQYEGTVADVAYQLAETRKKLQEFLELQAAQRSAFWKSPAGIEAMAKMNAARAAQGLPEYDGEPPVLTEADFIEQPAT